MATPVKGTSWVASRTAQDNLDQTRHDAGILPRQSRPVCKWHLEVL